MSGFPKDEAWYVPRCYSGLPKPIEELEVLLFPKINEWRKQMNDYWGDKCSHYMLDGLLPFLVQVAVQDGVYWN